MAANTKARGVSGVYVPAGIVTGVEDNRKLRADLARGTVTDPGEYDRMVRQDPQIRGAVIRPIVATLLDAGVEIVPPDDADDTDMLITEHIESAWENIRPQQTLREMLTYLSRGFALFEVVLKRTSDGLLTWRDFGPRLQRTVQRWIIDRDSDELREVEFFAPFGGESFQTYRLDARDLLHLALDQEGNNFEGVSLLRPAYTFWLIKKQILRATAIDVERSAHGFMKFTRSEPDAASTDDDNARHAEIARNWRTNFAAYADLPFGVDLEFTFPEIPFAERETFLRYLDQQIAKTALTTFLELGLGTAGTQSLGDTQLDLFIKALSDQTTVIESAMNGPGGRSVNGAIQKLVNMNWGPRDRYPQFRFKPVNRESAAQSLKAMSDAQTAGTFGEWRTEDANAARRIGGLPMLPISDEDRTDVASDDADKPDETAIDKGGATEPDGIDDDTAALRDGRTFRKIKPGTEVDVFDGVGARMVVHRPLTPCEGVVAFSELESLFKVSEDAFEAAVRPLLDDASRMLARDVRAIVFGAGSQAAKLRRLNKLSISADAESAIEDAIAVHLAAVAAKTETVTRSEIRRQAQRGGIQTRQRVIGTKGTRVAVGIDTLPVPDIDDIVRAQAMLATQSLLGEATGAVRGPGAIAIQVGAAGAADSLRQIDNAVAVRSAGSFRKHASQPTASTVTSARQKAAQETLLELGIKDVAFVQFSALLDGNTCGPCADTDGTEVAFGSSEFFRIQPPFQGCDSAAAGLNRCRCINVFVGSAEEPQLA